MISVKVTGNGLIQLRDRLGRLGRLDFTPFMQTVAEPTILEGNQKGLLAGQDKDGRTMPATARESGTGSSRRKGSGPPLVPRGSASRAIRLARTDSGKLGPNTYYASIYWENFTSDEGKEILPMHANPGGKARYPRRDVIGIRPETRKVLNRKLLEWTRKELGSR